MSFFVKLFDLFSNFITYICVMKKKLPDGFFSCSLPKLMNN